MVTPPQRNSLCKRNGQRFTFCRSWKWKCKVAQNQLEDVYRHGIMSVRGTSELIFEFSPPSRSVPRDGEETHWEVCDINMRQRSGLHGGFGTRYQTANSWDYSLRALFFALIRLHTAILPSLLTVYLMLFFDDCSCMLSTLPNWSHTHTIWQGRKFSANFMLLCSLYMLITAYKFDTF